MKVAVHITHEAANKIGGIGAVLNGICTAGSYNAFFDRTILYGPLFVSNENSGSELGDGAEILYSSTNSQDVGNWSRVFDPIRRKYGVDVVYGKRRLSDEFDLSKQSTVEVVLLGVNRMDSAEVLKFKYRFWERFGIQSELYAESWDYEQYLRIALPFLEILDALCGKDADYYHLAHEYMGIPCALSAAKTDAKHKTIFVAHEVSTARFLVENSPGHDISFYNILRKAGPERSLEQVFGSQKHNPRNELVKRAVHLDRIMTVSDLIRDEYLFLVPQAPAEKIRIVYNGLPARDITFDEKRKSRERIRKYVDTLFNFQPDVILTHVTRLVISKGIWRDISLLYHLDELFDSRKIKGVYILLSTSVASGRSPQDILRMEKEYGWPIMHVEGWPDLVGMESQVYEHLQLFNSRSRAIKGVFLNQFGFNSTRCGSRVPADAGFLDLRIASDAELGFSVYEPFGIAQLETVPFGGISVLSSSCGSAFFLRKVFESAEIKPFYTVDFVAPGNRMKIDELKSLTIEQRNLIERDLLSKHAKSVFELLPLTDAKRENYIENVKRYVPALSWENVVEKYFLPSLSI